MLIKSKNARFLFYAAGVFCFYLVFGLLQERITSGKYENQDGTSEHFTYFFAFCGVQNLTNYLFAKAMLFYWQQPKDKTRKSYYASSALTYLLGMVSSNMALQWVPYPTQVIGKSAKPIPVMLLGVLIGRRSYPLRKYVFVFLIVSGIALFMYKDKVSRNTSSSFGLGEILLLLSLTMDGLTGAVQERMRSESAPSAQHMMKSMNAWSCLYLAFALVCTGEGYKFVQFCITHPEICLELGTLAVCGGFGQLFILLCVSEFGPLPCSIVTTTRKFFTVLGSLFIFGNVLTNRQWLGTIAVFSGLFLDAIYGKSSAIKNDMKK